MRARALLVALVLAYASQARAEDCEVLLQPYQRTFTAPASETFTLATTAGEWYVTLETDGPARATLNGVALLGPKDTGVVRRAFTPAASNRLEVTQVQRRLTVRIEGVVPAASASGEPVFRRTFLEETFDVGTRTVPYSAPSTRGLSWVEVENGPDGADRASSALVSVDGRTVADTSDFNQTVESFAVPVVLVNGGVSVEVRALKAARVRVRLRGIAVDPEDPTVRLVAPGDVWSSAAARVVVELGDATSGVAGATFSLNGADVTARFTRSGSEASATLGDLAPVEGANELVVVARDHACRETRAVFTLRYDSRPPAIATNVGAFTNATPTVIVHVTDPMPGSGFGGDFAAVLDGSDVTSAFSVDAMGARGTLGPLAEGPHVLELRARDQASPANPASLRVEWTVDATPPSLSVQPGDGAMTGRRPTFTAIYSDALSGVATATFRAVLDGQDVTSAFVVTSSNARGTLGPLAPGPHELVAQVADQVGNGTERRVVFEVRPLAPTLSVTPANGAFTNDTIPAITLYHGGEEETDLSSVSLALDGRALALIAQIATATVFLPDGPLAEGVHTIEARARNGFGIEATLTSTFTVKIAATSLEVTISPADPIEARRPLVRLRGQLRRRARHDVPRRGPVGAVPLRPERELLGERAR